MPVVDPSPDELSELVEESRTGDSEALNGLVAGLVDGVYRLALRMTGNPADAEDATQEVMIKVVTHLSTFRGEASVRTWTYRIAVRHLLDRRKGQLEVLGLDFDRFAADLMDGLDPRGHADPAAAEEVKLGCTLAMLTCLDREHRVAYVLGDIFDLPSSIAAAIADVPDGTYRQRLSRARREVEAFTKSYCGVVNPQAPCRCEGRVRRAIELGRLDPNRPRLVPDILKMNLAVYASYKLHDELLRARERSVKESEELLRVGRKLSLLLEDLPIGVLISDAEGRICQTTEEVARILGSLAPAHAPCIRNYRLASLFPANGK